MEHTTKFRKYISIFLIAITTLISGCVADGGGYGDTQAQTAYNTCTSHWNRSFRPLKNHKAMVAGVDGGRTRCFWTWDSSSAGKALGIAKQNCANAGFSNCFAYAIDSRDEDWVARIANNHGRDPNNGSGNSGNEAEMAGAILNGLVTGMGAVNQPSVNRPTRQTTVRRYPSGGGGGGGGDNCPGATIAHDPITCEVLH